MSIEQIERIVLAKPDFVPESAWDKFKELGNSVADLVLDAFDVYASGDFGSWDKLRARNMFWKLCKLNEMEAIKRRNAVCEYILIQRMKQKDFFCCDLCQEVFYNYKQALIHLLDPNHEKNEEAAAVRDSRISSVGKLMSTFLEPPAISPEVRSVLSNFSKTDYMKISDYQKSHSAMFSPFVIISNGPRSDTNTAPSLLEATKNAVEQAKSEVGRNAMNALHKFLGENTPYCILCLLNTGNREKYYTHMIGHAHMGAAALCSRKRQHERPNQFDEMRLLGYNSEYFRFDPVTTLVNVHKKDLA